MLLPVIHLKVLGQMSLYQQSTMPWRNLLLAALLCLHLGCILVEAFAANLPSHTEDPHHSFGLVTQAEHALSERVLQSHADNTGQLTLTEHGNHACDHCKHCHASHLGLFNVSTALNISSELQLIGYQNQPPSSPQANIYRPPIA